MFSVAVVGVGIAVYFGVGLVGERLSSPVKTETVSSVTPTAAAHVMAQVSAPKAAAVATPRQDAGADASHAAPKPQRVAVVAAKAATRAKSKRSRVGAAKTALTHVKAPARHPHVLAGAHEKASASTPTVVASQSSQNIEVKVVNRQAQVEAAVTELRKAAGTGNKTMAKRSLQQLGRLRGSNNPFVLKLRAFWLLSIKDYKGAEVVLGQVLDDQPDDVDAGVNMVIAQLSQGERRAAQRRAEQLISNHPDDPRVRELQRYFQ